jgi:hypothetical protein
MFDRRTETHYNYAPPAQPPRRDVAGWAAIVVTVVLWLLGPGPNIGPWRDSPAPSRVTRTVVTTTATTVLRHGQLVRVTVERTTEKGPVS